MEDAKELIDESLEEVSGGATLTISALNVGDCFIDKMTRSNVKQKIYIAADYPVLNPAMAIKYRKYDRVRGIEDYTYTMSWSEICSYYKYSEEDSNPLIFG